MAATWQYLWPTDRFSDFLFYKSEWNQPIPRTACNPASDFPFVCLFHAAPGPKLSFLQVVRFPVHGSGIPLAPGPASRAAQMGDRPCTEIACCDVADTVRPRLSPGSVDSALSKGLHLLSNHYPPTRRINARPELPHHCASAASDRLIARSPSQIVSPAAALTTRLTLLRSRRLHHRIGPSEPRT